MTGPRDEALILTERQPGDQERIRAMSGDPDVSRVRRDWMQFATRHGYSYNFTWLGVPIIQHPEDVVVLQELLWRTRPDLVIETGIAHGGSLLLSASVLRLLGGSRHVLGVDVDIRTHTKEMLSTHPLAESIATIEGDSVSFEVVDQVRGVAAQHERVCVILDSNHTSAHVREELRLYADLVSVGCHLVAMDTVLKDLPEEMSKDRPWGPHDNPWTAVNSFLTEDDRFTIDAAVDDKLLASAAPGGYLLRTR